MLTPYLTVRQVSEWLQIPESTLYAWAAQGRIPCVRVNTLVRFSQEALNQWLDSSRPVIKGGKVRIAVKRALDIQAVIDRAKQLAYTPARGNQTNSEPNGKEDSYGAR